MKRTLALTLALLIFAASLASCVAAPKAAFSAAIRVTSSDAEDAAAWLTSRLGDFPADRVVIGTDADGYGLDLSALEDDGFFIRSFGRVFAGACGGEDVLFAKTPEGLDRAVRKYAKMAEAGEVFDVTYHEGYRVKRIEIAGRDVSEYTIYCEDGRYMPGAASELSSLIERACGASLPVSTDAPSAPYISLRYVHDESLSSCGYRWSVTDDGLSIECSDGYMPYSATFAVERFVELELGWFGLTYGYDSLGEAEFISIPVGRSGGEVNAFRYVNFYGDSLGDPSADKFDHSFMTLSGVPNCCHGLQNNKFAAELSSSGTGPWADDQPCYLSDEFFEVSYDDVSAYIEDHLAGGKVIGEDLCFVDIAAGDNAGWCTCKDCTALLKAEGARSAFILTWANRLSEALDEVYPGLTYGVFAYLGTNKTPKTIKPNEHISVTYCYDNNCAVHVHDGRDCDETAKESYLEDWLAICDNVYVWGYAMDEGFMSACYTGMVRDNLRYFHDAGVKGIMWEAEDKGFSTGKIAKWLSAALTWDIDMTDEEYDACLDRILTAMYGDGAPYVKEYCACAAMIQRSGRCASSGFTAAATPTFNPAFIAPAFDTLYSLCEAALRAVDCRRQEVRMTKLWAACAYQGCAASYFDAYDVGDDGRVAELSRRYALIEKRLDSCGISARGSWQGGIVVWERENWESDMEVMAWTSWKKNAKMLTLNVPERAMPERVAQILADMESGE